MSPLQVFIVIACMALAGCSGDPPFGGFPSQPPVVEATDLKPLAGAMKFVGLCSVGCSSIWAAAILLSANLKRKESNEHNR